MERLILLIWPIALIDALVGRSVLTTIGGAILAVYLVASLATARPANRILALMILAAATGVATVDGRLAAIPEAFSETLVLAAFVPSAHLLRSVAESDQRVRRFRDLLGDADPGARPAWLLVGSNLLGSVLTVGAVAVLSPVFADRSQPSLRRNDAVSVVAGTALALTWSPFFVAMAVVSSFLPDVPLWAAILMGLGLSALGLAITLVLLRTPKPLRTAARAAGALRGFVPLIAIAGLAVVLLRLSGDLSTLAAACVTMPPLCALLVVTRAQSVREGARQIPEVLRYTAQRIRNIGAEVGILALAFMLGLVVRSSPAVSDAVAASGLAHAPGLLILFIVPLGMIGAGMLSVHPIVSASLMLAVFSGQNTGVSDLALMGATLVGWSASAMLSFSGLLLMVTTSLGDVPRSQLIFGRNILVALIFATLGALVLALLNRTIV
ncbi:hypothetical protein [Microbaculum sp. FT89]|uniref:hypothetical protein n=1 Tax=Microbaculum sp. FT89 TaxID=3447298 RepID=UPI003F53BA92